MKKSIVISCIILIIGSISLFSQNRSTSYGLFGSANINDWSMDLNRFGFLPASDPHNAKSSEFGTCFGLFVDIPFSAKFSFNLRAGLMQGKANLSNEYTITTALTDSTSTVERALHEIEADALSFIVEPSLRFKIIPVLDFYGGFGLGFRFNNESHYYKTIYEYTGGMPEHELNSKYIKKTINPAKDMTMSFYFNFGLSYKPTFLGTKDWLAIEVGYSAGYVDLGEDYPLDYGTLRFGIVLSVSDMFCNDENKLSSRPPNPSDEKRLPVRDSVVEIVKPKNK
jgi:hypothetical protein